MPSDQRSYPRIQIERRIGIIQSTGEVAYCRGTDISLGGVGILCDHGADKGQQFDIFFNVLVNDALKRIEARARVIYVHVVGSDHYRYRLGTQFVSFSGKSREMLTDFLGERLR